MPAVTSPITSFIRLYRVISNVKNFKKNRSVIFRPLLRSRSNLLLGVNIASIPHFINEAVGFSLFCNYRAACNKMAFIDSSSQSLLYALQLTASLLSNNTIVLQVFSSTIGIECI